MSSSDATGTGQGTEREPPAPGEWVPLDEAREIFAPPPPPGKQGLADRYRYFRGQVEQFPRRNPFSLSQGFDSAKTQRDSARSQLDSHLWKLLKAGELIGRGKSAAFGSGWDKQFSPDEWDYLKSAPDNIVRSTIDKRAWYSVQVCQPAPLAVAAPLASGPEDLPPTWTRAEQVVERCYPDHWAEVKRIGYIPLFVGEPNPARDRADEAASKLCNAIAEAVLSGKAQLGCFPRTGDPSASITAISNDLLILNRLQFSAMSLTLALALGEGGAVSPLFLRTAQPVLSVPGAPGTSEQAAPARPMPTHHPDAEINLLINQLTNPTEVAAIKLLLDELHAHTGPLPTKGEWLKKFRNIPQVRAANLADDAFNIRLWPIMTKANTALSRRGARRKTIGKTR